MADSVSARKTPAQRAPAREARPAAKGAPSLNVRYWKRMRPNKVYPVVVSAAGRGDVPVTVRVVMAGAQVVPAEQTMVPGQPGEKLTFYVTPLARGGLRGERVEVLQDGKKVQEIRIPCKVVTQRPTLVWLFLALFVPWLILHYFVYAPVGYQPPLDAEGKPMYVEDPSEHYLKDVEVIWSAKTRKAKQPSPEKPVAQKELPSARITHFIEDNTPDLKPLLADWPDIANIYQDIQGFPEKAYLHLFIEYHNLGQPLAFYLFLVLLFITFVSFVLKQEGRRTVYGRPLPVAEAAE
jgi:hypothetical protein